MVRKTEASMSFNDHRHSAEEDVKLDLRPEVEVSSTERSTQTQVSQEPQIR